MFGLFKSNQKAKLQKAYNKLLEEGVALQRKGDIKGYAQKTEEAEALLKKIQALPES